MKVDLIFHRRKKVTLIQGITNENEERFGVFLELNENLKGKQ